MRGRKSAVRGRKSAVRGRKSANYPQGFAGEEISRPGERFSLRGRNSARHAPEKGRHDLPLLPRKIRQALTCMNEFGSAQLPLDLTSGAETDRRYLGAVEDASGNVSRCLCRS